MFIDYHNKCSSITEASPVTRVLLKGSSPLLHFFVHQLVDLVHVLEVETVVVGQVDGVEVHLLDFGVQLPVAPGPPDFDDYAPHLDHVPAHHNHQNQNVVRLKQLAVVLVLFRPVDDQEDEGGCEEAEQPGVEDVALASAEILLLGHPTHQHPS
jgi:hypothetical protein